VAIGTAHGTYVTKPKLDVERLKQIRAAVDTPLVLHGGSGLTDEDFRNTIAGGITKINIYTDVVVAGKEALQKAFADGLCLADARTVKVAGIKEAVKAKMTLFGSVGKA
jgi:fructose-bisphosphate aldolase class II